MGKKENVLKTIGASLGFFVIYIGIINLFKLCFNCFYYLTYSDLRKTDYEAFSKQVQTLMASNMTLIALLTFVVFFLVIFIIFRAKGKNLVKSIRWNPVSKQICFLVALFAIANFVTIILIMDILMPQSLVQGASDYSAHVTTGALLFNFLLVVIIGPLGEEFMMRGLMTGRLLGRLPLWLAVGLPTILFGLGHIAGGMGQIIGTTATGLVFTLVFVWTNSLRTAALAHALSNLFAVFMPMDVIKSAMNTPMQLIVGIVAFAVTVFAGYLIYKRWDKEIVIV